MGQDTAGPIHLAPFKVVQLGVLCRESRTTGRQLVKFPVCCASDLGSQYNTGDDELKIPNRMPDLVTKVGFNASKRFHVEVGGVFRAFRHTLKPYDQDYTQSAGGGFAAGKFQHQNHITSLP